MYQRNQDVLSILREELHKLQIKRWFEGLTDVETEYLRDLSKIVLDNTL